MFPKIILVHDKRLEISQIFLFWLLKILIFLLKQQKISIYQKRNTKTLKNKKKKKLMQVLSNSTMIFTKTKRA